MSENIPIIKKSSRFNLFTSIWIVPFISLLIAGWLAFQYFSQLGPKIEIVFKNNKGLKSGQSQIKYRDVVIGKIEKVALRNDGDGVKVIARMDKEAIPYLNDNAEFWIVKPEVGIGGISGLDTIISGTYINMSSKKTKMNKKEFIGLEKSIKIKKKGLHLHLNSSTSYNITEGTPIFFKELKAGEVENVEISDNGKSVDISIFIKDTFQDYIHLNSKFWVKSALNIDYVHGKLDFTLAPITNIIRGGIEFSSSGKDNKNLIDKDFVFRLYKNSSIAINKRIGKRGKGEVKDYLLTFEKSTAKLNRDASLVYKGYDIGRVQDIKLLYNSKTHVITSNILVSLDSSIFYDLEYPKNSGEDNLKEAVNNGLRASIESRDPLTKLQYIELLFTDDNISKRIVNIDKYSIFPTIDRKESSLIDGLDDILFMIKNLPLKELIVSTNKSIDSFGTILDDNKASIEELLISVNRTLNSLNKLIISKELNATPLEINRTLKSLRKSLKTVDSLIRGDKSKSLLSSQLTKMLEEVYKTSIATRKLIKQIDKKPNLLIFGD